MESTLQKITLYDILGYLLPGSAFLILVLYGMGEEKLSVFLGQWADDQGVLYFAFFVAAYLVGIVLSEIMRWIWPVIRKLYKKRPETGLSDEEIAEALKKSGKLEGKGEIKRKVREDLDSYYMQYMYGIIQKSEDNKRIHNYASAQVLYKNVSGALFLGALFSIIFGHGAAIWLYAACFFMSIVFLIREARFEQKKNKYTVIWFVEKYLGNTQP